MNAQTSGSDDGQPAEPLPQPGPGQPTDDPQGPPLPAPGPAPQQQDFFTWVRGHHIQRGRDRWIGGVCSGIAQRAGIDPLIVRGIFVVLTIFAGIGVLLYGVAWAFLPEPDGRIHVQEAGAGRWSSGMTGSLIAVILGFTGLGGGVWGSNNLGTGAFLWTLFWVAAAGYVIYYLIQRNKATTGAPIGMPPPPGAAGSTGTSGSAPAPHVTAYPGPGAESYPAYGAVQPVHGPPRGSWVRPAGPGTPAVAITAGTALLVGGGLKALDAGNVLDLGGSANAVVWAGSAAVLGLGILVSGIRGRTAGVLSLFAVVALITAGIYNVAGNGDRVRFQEVRWAPASAEQAAEGLDITAGRGTVDLTGLQLDAPLSSDVVIPLNITASNVAVLIPDNVPVLVKADMTLGNINDGGGRGGATSREVRYNTAEPGSDLVIQIDGTLSNVSIQEGN